MNNMLGFNDLSPARKRWVMLVELTHPEVTDTITYQQIKDFHAEFAALREQDKRYKIGMPLWLIGPNAIERGVYFFPGTNNTVPVKVREADSDMELEYKQELAEYGL
jgi:hypothetical protein